MGVRTPAERAAAQFLKLPPCGAGAGAGAGAA